MVNIIADTLFHMDGTQVEIYASGGDFLKDDTKLKIDLDGAGKMYGTLSVGGLKGKSFDEILYGLVKERKLQYIADGRNPLTTDCCAQLVKISVCLVDKGEISGEDSAWVHCKNSPPRYPQGGNESWADDVYNHLTGEKNKIRNKGCALCCLAMVMTAFGDTIDPGGLNEWMKDQTEVSQGGYSQDGGVSWYAPTKHVLPKKMNLIGCNRKEMFTTVDSVTAAADTIKINV